MLIKFKIYDRIKDINANFVEKLKIIQVILTKL